MRHILSKCLIVAVALLSAFPTFAEELQPRADILKTLIKVNDYYMKQHPDPLLGIPYYSRKKVYEANIWTRAV
ncbi:MAG: glycoside hydrolase family 88 protein, partial [Duncaniella sp.]|nr:glycoside hydrolase family 88 protein [Duncaniella sp.]